MRNLWCEPRIETSSKPSAFSRAMMRRLSRSKCIYMRIPVGEQSSGDSDDQVAVAVAGGGTVASLEDDGGVHLLDVGGAGEEGVAGQGGAAGDGGVVLGVAEPDRAGAGQGVGLGRRASSRANPMLTEPEQDITWGEFNVGTRSIFEAAGFRQVSHHVPRRVVMRIDFEVGG